MNPKNKWVEISLPVTEQTEDAITNFLFELGASGSYVQEDMLLAYVQNSIWTEQKHAQLIHYLQQLVELQFAIRLDQLRVTTIEDRDWNALWKQSIKPITIDSKIIIKPSWINISPTPGLHIIEIDPQMAFGTGMHATTQLMLKFIIAHIGAAERVIDIGTGTGILAIAAARLSDAVIVAFDNDPIAAATAQENCIKNSIQDRIHLFCGTLDAIKNIRFDAVLANINRSTIVSLLADICDKMKPSGLAMLSGILIDEKSAIVKQLERFPLKIVNEQQSDEWIGFVIQKM